MLRSLLAYAILLFGENSINTCDFPLPIQDQRGNYFINPYRLQKTVFLQNISFCQEIEEQTYIKLMSQ